MPLPDAIICGFPKCGTSRLSKSLSIVTNYFDNNGLGEEQFFTNWDMSENQLNSYMMNFRENCVNLSKDGAYVFFCGFMKKIRYVVDKYKKNIKIILCIRNPIQAYMSYVNHNKEHSSFDVNKGEYFANMKFFYYDYPFYIRNNVLSLFDTTNIYFVIQERLKNDFEKEFSKVLRFLGLQYDKSVNYLNDDNILTKKYHENISVKHDEFLRYNTLHLKYWINEFNEFLKNLLNICEPIIHNTKNILNDPLEEWDEITNYYKGMIK